jgi:hypothetical protein
MDVDSAGGISLNSGKNYVVAVYSLTFNKHVSLVLLKCYTSIPSTLLWHKLPLNFNQGIFNVKMS